MEAILSKKGWRFQTDAYRFWKDGIDFLNLSATDDNMVILNIKLIIL